MDERTATKWTDMGGRLCHCGQPVTGNGDPWQDANMSEFCNDCRLMRCDAYGHGDHVPSYNTPAYERPEAWLFSWGFGHMYPNCYVRIEGTFHSSRQEMVRRYGTRWAFQYPESDEADLIAHDMHNIDDNFGLEDNR
jgi:hypothetical protein